VIARVAKRPLIFQNSWNQIKIRLGCGTNAFLNRVLYLTLTTALQLLLVLSGSGCLSLELPGRDGHPRAMLSARKSYLDTLEGTAVRIRSDGLALRFHRQVPGITLGRSETVYFCPDSGGGNALLPPIAVLRKSAGIDIGPHYLSIGTKHRLEVSRVDGEESARFLLVYEEGVPGTTVRVRREEFP
jgi:hypothetical protein